LAAANLVCSSTDQTKSGFGGKGKGTNARHLSPTVLMVA